MRIQDCSSRLLGNLTRIVVTSLLLSTTCRAESGRVIDESSGKPIAGAFVFALWVGSAPNPVVSKSRCFHYALTKADKDGRFTLPDISGNVEPWLVDRQRTVGAYAPGYEELPFRKANSPELPLRKYAGPALPRLKRLATLAPSECMSDKQDRKLLPLYEAMYEEGKGIAKEREELRYLAGIRAGIARLTMGEKVFKKSISSGEYFK